MKDYKEIAENVLRRSREEMEKKRRKKRMLARNGCAVAACGLAAVICAGVFWKERPLEQADKEKPSVNAADAKNTDAGGAPAGDISGMDDRQENGKDETMDGDPAGYGSGAGQNKDAYPSVENGNAPVPGGKTEGGTEGETNAESKIEISAPVEDSMPSQTEEAGLPSNGITADVYKSIPGGAVDGEVGTTPMKMMISSYPEDVDYCYMAPGNGEFFCSAPLLHAMEEYGDDALYCVLIKIFRDERTVRTTDRISGEEKLEWDRLAELGYTVAWETYDNGEKKEHYFMLHATKEQLENFDASEEYGYFLQFRDEP